MSGDSPGSRGCHGETSPMSKFEQVSIQPHDALPSIPGYEVLCKLGQGGMGVVYKARQLGRDRLVALKIILSGRGASFSQVARFRVEAEAVACLAHPNIV